jgi:hypothetical protein
MPFSGPGTYLETIDEFDGHWADVDAELSPSTMTLPGGYTRAAMGAHRTALATKMADLEGFINTLEFQRTVRDQQELPLLEDMKMLGAYVRGPLMKSGFRGVAPSVPSLNASAGKWRTAMDDCNKLWTDLHANPPAGFVPPLILPNTTTLAQFQAKITAHAATLTAVTNADQDVDRVIYERDLIYGDVRTNLTEYRPTVLGMFGETHPLFLSVPLLNPLPGHTPDPVALTANWDVSKSWAEFNWTASADPDIANYVLRRSGSNPYSGATEQHVATIDPGELTITTDEGLLTPGGTMRFKIYVVLSTGNERGSNVVEITRPV